MADTLICPKCSAPNPLDTVFCGKCGAQMASGDTEAGDKDPLIGSFVGDRFLVHEKLGEGGMGVVYRAEQTAIGRTVALKVLHGHLTRDESLHARFHNEAAASSRLTHPNTVTIYDFGKTDIGSLYIAMEFVEGESLDDEIRNRGAMEWHRSCRLGVQICGSLMDAHSNSIVHRDLKPENIMLCERGGEADVAKVLDFGIAKILEDDGTDQRQALTKTGMVFGTPQYMSPEQIRGERVDNRTDIYSLGVILYQMLTGVLPFTADMPMGVLSKHLMDTPPPFKTTNPNADIPESVESVVMSCLEKETDKRPQTMRDLASQLAGAADLTGGTMLAGGVVATQATPPPAGHERGGGPGAKPPPTDVQAGVAGAEISRQKRGGGGKMAGIIVAVLILLGGGGAAAWYFLAGPGAGKKPARRGPARVAATQNPTPLQPQPGQVLPQPAQPQPTQPQPAQAQPGAVTGAAVAGQDTSAPSTAPLAATPEANPTPNSESGGKDKKPRGDRIKKPDVKKLPSKKEAACSFAGSADPIAEAIRTRLKSRVGQIKKCAKNNSAGRTAFSFRVPKGKSRPQGIQVTAASNASSCLKSVLDGDFGKTEKATRTGNAAFDLAKAGGVVHACRVTVNAKKKKGIPGLLPGTIIKKKPSDKKPSDKKPSEKKPTKKKPTKKKPGGIRVIKR